MAVTAANLIPAKYAENSQTTQYVATNKKARVDSFTVTNPTAGAVTISIYKVVSAGSASDANVILKSKSVAAGETLIVAGMIGQILEPEGFISTIASAATSLVISASGVEIT